MSDLKFQKVLALPTTFTPNTIYIVGNGEFNNVAGMYVSDLTGTTVRSIVDVAFTSDLIKNMLAEINSGRTFVVDTYSDLSTVDTNLYTMTMVIDATGDVSVNSGAALYVYRQTTTSWVKISETESNDLVFDWQYLQNKPNATKEEIDAAVAASHSHSNSEVLNKIGEDQEGNITFNNVVITPTLLTKVEW